MYIDLLHLSLYTSIILCILAPAVLFFWIHAGFSQIIGLVAFWLMNHKMIYGSPVRIRQGSFTKIVSFKPQITNTSMNKQANKYVYELVTLGL